MCVYIIHMYKYVYLREGYRSLTATDSPSCVTARCTCASDAAATGRRSMLLKSCAPVLPKDAIKTGSMREKSLNGAPSVNTASVWTYAFGTPLHTARHLSVFVLFVYE